MAESEIPDRLQGINSEVVRALYQIASTPLSENIGVLEASFLRRIGTYDDSQRRKLEWEFEAAETARLSGGLKVYITGSVTGFSPTPSNQPST